jgi:hypothetical protein
VERVWGVGATGVSIFWKTPGTALYSTYVSTLCATASHKLIIVSRVKKTTVHRILQEVHILQEVNKSVAADSNMHREYFPMVICIYRKHRNIVFTFYEKCSSA